jgi:peptidoglycan/LPS O-acetylase OafA/YrhL
MSVQNNAHAVPLSKTPHLFHLDSLRGIAAMMVALCHSLNMFRDIPHARYLEALTGRSPVIFFFLLSGFVLCRSLCRNPDLSLRALSAYYIRRLFRLYPAVLGALILGALAAVFYTMPASWSPASPLLRKLFQDAMGVSNAWGYLKQVLLVEIALDRPLWSIRTEFIGSLVLPFIVWILVKHRGLAMPLGILMAVFFAPSESHLYLILFPFYLGCLICIAEPQLHSLSLAGTKWLLFLGGMLWLSYLRGGFLDLATGCLILGGLLAVLVPCHWEGLRNLLTSGPLVFLGKISFSFYLLHRPVSMLVWGFLEKNAPGLFCHFPAVLAALSVFLLTIALAIPLSMLMERLVERPFNTLGHRLSKTMASEGVRVIL